MSPPAVSQRLTDADPLLIDVREPEEFAFCRIPGSRLIPMRQIPDHIHSLPRDRELIIVCHHGIRSLQVAAFLEQNGFVDVINLEGGVAAWAEQVDPAMPRY